MRSSKWEPPVCLCSQPVVAAACPATPILVGVSAHFAAEDILASSCRSSSSESTDGEDGMSESSSSHGMGELAANSQEVAAASALQRMTTGLTKRAPGSADCGETSAKRARNLAD